MCKWIDDIATKWQPWTWLVMRVLASLMFITHGWGKIFGDGAQSFLTSVNPETGAVIGSFFGLNLGINMLWVAGVIEVFGGLLLVVGLWTRIAAFFSWLLMVMAYFTAHAAWFPTLNRGELAAMYFLVYLVIFAYGPGPYSIDEKFLKKK